jgi:hypothetical protein
MKEKGGSMKPKLAMKARLSSFILPPSSFDIGAGDEI